jgi:hypothetical protein
MVCMMMILKLDCVFLKMSCVFIECIFSQEVLCFDFRYYLYVIK